MTPPPIALNGLGAIAQDFDGFILDIWGVVHDGTRVYPGVVEALDRLLADGKPYVFLTNAPRRIADVVRMLKRLDLPERHRGAIVTSGEAARQAIEARADPFHAGLGRRCFVFGESVGSDLLAGLDLERVGTLDEASFIVNIGPWNDGTTLADYEGPLAQGAALDLPMVCANPDLRVMRGDVELICAGALAERYAELGGRVFYHGKPHRPIYDACFAALPGIPRERILAVGDFLGTDIKGAVRAGLASALVLGGLHAGELAEGGADPGRLFAAHGVAPRFTLPGFAW